MKLIKLSLVMLLVAGSAQAGSGSKAFWGGFGGSLVGSAITRPARVVVEDGASNRKLKRTIRRLEDDIDGLYNKLNKKQKRIEKLEDKIERLQDNN